MTLFLERCSKQGVRLDELTDSVTSLAIQGEGGGQVVEGITCDSRAVVQGSLFVAVRGYSTDGHHYISSAVERGAVAVICEEFPDQIDASCCYIKVAEARKALAEASKVVYGNSADRLIIIGVTGTNGKTTTAKLITAMLNMSNIPAGYIGTNLCRIGDRDIALDRTTPEAHELHALFGLMEDAGCRAAVMEVSSHALVLQRVYGIWFHAALFTNLTMEHLDFHGTMEEYASAKQQMFRQLAPDGFAVFNSDDPFSAQLSLPVVVEKRYLCTIQSALPPQSRCGHHFGAHILKSSLDSTTVKLHFPAKVILMEVKLPGEFNVMNVLEAAALGTGMALQPEQICQSLSAISAVDGRMERVGDGSERYSVFVDYAHTPDALLKVLVTLRFLKQEGSRLVVVFGCGGNRDRSKRSEMGRIASELADVVFLTSDNPRDENPETILDEIETGMAGREYRRISDRAEALACAVAQLREGDVLLVAGKGHERYQEIAGKKYPFSDQDIIKQSMKKNGAGVPAKEQMCQ